MLKYIRRKIHEISRLHNTLSEQIEISDSVYISGSTIDGQVRISDSVRIYQSYIEGIVSIGRYTSLWGPGIHVLGRANGVSIGNFCSIARYVSIQEDYHNPHRTTTYFIEKNLFETFQNDDAIVSKGKISIGHDVWIGAGAHILSGVRIGTGAIIGAGSVVTKDVPDYAIAAGNPAQIKGFRFSEGTRKKLIETAWWDWPLEKLKDNADFLTMVHDR